MNTSSRLVAALLSSMTLFACASASPATQRTALGPSDDAAWHPGDTTELSLGGAAAGSATRPVRRESLRPIALRPNRHEVPRARLVFATSK